MKRKLTVRAIVDASAALMKLGEKELKKQPLSLRLARVRRVFVTEAREIENERRKIEQEYAIVSEGTTITDEEGGVRLTDPYEFQEKIKEYYDSEIELEFAPVPLADFGEKFPWAANVLDPLLFAGIVETPEEQKAVPPHDDSALAEPEKVKTADED